MSPTARPSSSARGVTCLDFKRKIGPSRWWSASYCLLDLDAITGKSSGGAGGAFGPTMTR